MTSESPVRRRILGICVVLAALFNLLALMVLLRFTPTVFTVFMFVGQPLFIVALILLLGAVLADLRAKELL